MMDILEALHDAQRRGVAPPQNWVSRAADEIERLTRERDALRAFAQDVMDDWPDGGDIDGGTLQDFALKNGLLRAKDPQPTEPCGDECLCAYYSGRDPADWVDGVLCYERTAILLGHAAPPPAPGETK